MKYLSNFLLFGCFFLWKSPVTYTQCDVDPSWIVAPSDLNITFNSSDFAQGTVCPGADPFIDPTDSGTPTLIANDTSPDCDVSELTLNYQDSWSSSDTDNDCIITITRLWKATYLQANGGVGEASGIQEIDIVDDVAPQLTCPTDLAIDLSLGCDETDPNVEADSGFLYGSGSVSASDFSSLTDGVAFDNCDTDLDISYNDGTLEVFPGACPGAFITWERTWVVTDNCGLTAQCVQSIELFDNNPPVYTSIFPDFDENMMITACDVFDPAVETISGLPFNESSTTFIDQDVFELLGGFVEDNCKDDYGLTYSYIDVYIDLPGNCPGELGQIFRVWTATDYCGNVETDRQEIFIYDNVGPDVTECPSDVEIFVFAPESCDNNNPQIELITGYPFSLNGTSLSNSGDFPGAAIDNCDGVNIAEVSYQDQVTQIGCESGSNVSFEITRTWSLFDACGNSTTCEQLIQLVDNEGPVLIGGPNFFIDQDYSNPTPMYFETVNCEMEVAWVDPAASDILDNCESFDDLVIWQSHESPHVFREGVTEVQYVFRDACGNQTSVVWEVTVVCVPCTPQNIYYLCTQPPTLCDLTEINTFSSCTPAPIGQEPISALCDTANVENPSYFEFVAAEESISVVYLIENCGSGMGLQMAVIDVCDPTSCYDDSRGACLNGFGFILATGLTVGNIYQIIVDGCVGDQCEYTLAIQTIPFELPDAQSEPPDSKSLTSASCNTDDLRFCVGAQVEFFPENFGEAGYNFCWSLDNLAGVTALNNQPNCGQAVVGTPQGMAFSCSDDFSSCGPLQLQFDQVGTYKLCLIELENGCDHLDLSDYCWEIEVIDHGPLDFGTHYVCSSDFPWTVDVLGPDGESWPGPPLFPGQELIFDTDFCGCMFEYMIDVRMLPEMQGEGDIRVCFDDRENWEDPILNVDWEDIENDYVPPAMGSEIFISFGSSQLGYDGDYCDTMVFYNVYVYDLPGQILVEPGPACDAILNFEIDTLLFPEFMDDEELNFIWKDDMGSTVDVGPTIAVSVDGVYTLEVQYEIDEWTTCTFVFVESVLLDNQMLAAPTFVEAPTQTCFNATSGLLFSVPTSSIATYTWSVSNGTFTTNASGEEILVSITDPNLPLNVSVFASSMCGVSPTEFATLNVVPAPVIELLPVQEICVGQELTISSNLISGSVDDYFWIVDDITAMWDMIGSSNQSSIEVSWATPGLQSFSLYIDDLGGCESNIVTGQVNVVQPLGEPIPVCINTSSTSVTIEWQDAQNGVGTNVVILSGQSGTLNGNQYIVTGLQAGETVQFGLQTMGGTYPCGDGNMITFSCEASDCNLNPMISTPEDLICLDGSETPFQLTEDNGFPGGEWSGNGVDPDGIFTPSDAGPGISTILYTVEDPLLDCSSSVELTITVFDSEVQEFTVSMDSVCVDELLTIQFQNITGVDYQWDFGLGSNMPNTLNSSFELSYSTPGIKYIELTSLSGADCESIFGLEVFVKPQLDFAGIFCESVTTNSVLFGWPESTQVDLFEAEIFINGSLELMSNPIDLIEVTNLDEGDIVEVVLVAFDSFGCNDIETTAMCIAQDCPDFQIDITASAMVACWDPSGVTISLSQMTFDESGAMADGTGSWVGTDVDPQTGIFTPTGPGEYSLLYRFEEDGSDCTATEEIQIQILNEPTSEFTLSQDELCITEPLILNYGGDYNTAIEFDWTSSLDDDDYILIDNMDGSFTVDFINSVSGTFELATTIGDCVSSISSESFQLEEVPNLPVVNCETTLSTVLFSWDDVPCADGYVVTINGMEMPMTQDNSIFVEDLAESEMVSIEVEVLSSCLCDFPNVIVEACSAQACEPATITFDIPVAGMFCASEIPAPFMVSTNVDGVNIDGTGIFQWSGIGVSADGLIDLAGFSSGSYPIMVTYTEAGCSYIESLTFEIFDEPVVAISVTDAPCAGYPFGEVDVAVDAVGTFALSIDQQSISEGINVLESGTYELTVIDGMGCEITETFEIGITSEPPSSLDGPGFIKLDSLGQFDYNIGVNPTSIMWTVNGEVYETIDCTFGDCTGLAFSPVEFGDYELCVTALYEEECEVTDCVNFLAASIAISDIYIPNIFNPESETEENQGLNLFVNGFDVLVEEVSIFDRWGNVVYKNDEQLGVASGSFETLWDGSFGDKDYMMGVYVYLVKISIDGEEEYLVGDVSVIK